MAPKKKRRLLLFVPEGEEGGTLQAAALAAHKGLESITMGPVPADPAAREARASELAETLRTPRKGFVIVDPPRDVDDLAWLDDVFRSAFGKRRKNLPVAVFFSPRAAKKKKPDPYEDYRESFRPRFHYYRKNRRSVSFEKPVPRAARKAVKLAGKRSSPVRWGVLLPICGTVLVVALVLLVFRDGLLRRGAVTAGEKAFDARVDIAGLATTFTPSLRLDAVAVADRERPMQNLFEFGTLEAGFDLIALLGGRFHVDRAELTGLAFRTPREESGALTGEEGAEEAEESSGFADELGRRLDLVFEDLAKKLEPPAPEDLETVTVAREIEAEARERLATLTELVDQNRSAERIRALQADVDALLEDPVPASLKDLRSAASGLGSISGDFALTTAKSRLTKLKRIAFDDERKQLDGAKKRVDGAEKKYRAAETAIANARKIKKLDLITATKLPGTIQDLRDSISGIGAARKDLVKARDMVSTAVDGIGTKRGNGGARLASVRDALTEARAGVADAKSAGADWKKLSTQLASARADVDARRTSITGAIAKAESEVKAARDSVTSLTNRVQGDVSFLSSAPTRLKEAAARDVDGLRARYSIEAFDSEEIVRTLVGEKVFGWLELGQSTYERFRPYLGGDEAGEDGKPVVRESDDGFTYDFPVPQAAGVASEAAEVVAQPGLWIRDAVFDGVLQLSGEDLQLSGTAADVSSAPDVIERDATAVFDAVAGDRKVGGNLRFTREDTLAVELTAAGFPVGGTTFRGRHAPQELADGIAQMGVRASFGEEGFRATVDVGLANMRLVPRADAAIDPRIASVLSTVYTSFDELNATFEIGVSEGSIETFDVTTDIGDELQGTFETALSGLVDEARAQAEAELESRLAGPRAEALAAVSGFDGDSSGLLARLTGDVEGSSDLVGAARARLDGELASLWELPSLGADPAAAAASLRKGIDELTGQANGEEKRLGAEADAGSAAADAVLSSLGVTDKRLGDVDALLDKELKRLLGLK